MHSCISLLFLFFRTGISERNDIYFQLRQEKLPTRKKPSFPRKPFDDARRFYNLFLYRKAGEIVFPCLQNFLLPLASHVRGRLVIFILPFVTTSIQYHLQNAFHLPPFENDRQVFNLTPKRNSLLPSFLSGEQDRNVDGRKEYNMTFSEESGIG